jgi:hypothetical protein
MPRTGAVNSLDEPASPYDAFPPYHNAQPSSPPPQGMPASQYSAYPIQGAQPRNARGHFVGNQDSCGGGSAQGGFGGSANLQAGGGYGAPAMRVSGFASSPGAYGGTDVQTGYRDATAGAPGTTGAVGRDEGFSISASPEFCFGSSKPASLSPLQRYVQGMRGDEHIRRPSSSNRGSLHSTTPPRLAACTGTHAGAGSESPTVQQVTCAVGQEVLGTSAAGFADASTDWHAEGLTACNNVPPTPLNSSRTQQDEEQDESQPQGTSSPSGSLSFGNAETRCVAASGHSSPAWALSQAHTRLAQLAAQRMSPFLPGSPDVVFRSAQGHPARQPEMVDCGCGPSPETSAADAKGSAEMVMVLSEGRASDSAVLAKADAAGMRGDTSEREDRLQGTCHRGMFEGAHASARAESSSDAIVAIWPGTDPSDEHGHTHCCPLMAAPSAPITVPEPMPGRDIAQVASDTSLSSSDGDSGGAGPPYEQRQLPSNLLPRMAALDSQLAPDMRQGGAYEGRADILGRHADTLQGCECAQTAEPDSGQPVRLPPLQAVNRSTPQADLARAPSQVTTVGVSEAGKGEKVCSSVAMKRVVRSQNTVRLTCMSLDSAQLVGGAGCPAAAPKAASELTQVPEIHSQEHRPVAHSQFHLESMEPATLTECPSTPRLTGTPLHCEASTPTYGALLGPPQETHIITPANLTTVTPSVLQPAGLTPGAWWTATTHEDGGDDVLLPEGVDLDDLIKLAQLLPASDGGPRAPGAPVSPDRLATCRQLLAQSSSAARVLAVLRASATGMARAQAAAEQPEVPGTSDPELNNKQQAAILARPAAPRAQPPAAASKPKAPPPPAPPLPPKAAKALPPSKPPPPAPPPPPKLPAKKKASPAPPLPPPPPPKRAPPSTPKLAGKTAMPPRPGSAPQGMRLVQPTEEQQKKLKQLHWDAVRTADGTIWRDVDPSTELDLAELERLFKLLDNKALKCASPLCVGFLHMPNGHASCPLRCSMGSNPSLDAAPCQVWLAT